MAEHGDGPGRIAVLVHDGFYGAGTGAGYANRAFLQILAGQLATGIGLLILPVRLTWASSEYDQAWHQRNLAELNLPGLRVLPVDNGTGGLVRFGGLAEYRHASARAAAILTSVLGDSNGPVAIVAFDVPFLGVPALLPPSLARALTVVPRSTALLHDPGDGGRVAFERTGLMSTALRGGRVAAISSHMREHLHRDYGVPASALISLGYGLTPGEREFADPDLALLPAPARAGFILAMGRAQPYKGWDDLIKALYLLRQSHRLPHAVLAAVTETPALTDYQRHLADRIAALGLDATLLTQFDHRIRDMLTHPALKAVVVPSRAEPFGRIPLEAYAADAGPVVATTAGGLAEQVIDTVTGFTAPPADPAGLAAAIGRALVVEPDQLDQMRRAGRQLLDTRFDATRNTIRFLRKIAPWALAGVRPRRCPARSAG